MPPNREPQVETSPLRLRHHYFYIVFWILLASLILYIPGGISYIDALILASGAATQSGLNPVDLNGLHLVQQITLWIVPMVTNVVFLHSLLVLIRLYWFRRRFKRAIHEAKALCHAERGRWNQHLFDSESPTLVGLTRHVPDSQNRDGYEYPLFSDPEDQERLPLVNSPEWKPANGATSPHITFDDANEDHVSKTRRHTYSSYPVTGQRRSSISSTRTRNSHDIYGSTMPSLPPLMWQSSIASYSQWDEAQKEELGGIEYRALKTLMIILVSYFLAFHILGMLMFMLWISLSPQYHSTLADIQVNKFWWAAFTSGSAFNDLGYTLSPDSMASFRYAPFPLLMMTFFIVMGNTGFPCMLRLIIWTLSKFASYGTPLDEELQYLLEHPRRCFTLLFPRADTWRLAAVLLLLNAIDLIIFYALQEAAQLDPAMSPGMKFVNGLFQIASTRTAGFTITGLSKLHPAIQVSFLVMMYISAFPIAIVMRKTNVYEEKSLGIYDNDHADDDDADADAASTMPHAQQGLVSHMQHQLGFDLWYVMLGFFVVAVAEGKRLQERPDDRAFSLFPILFEIVSGYGTVGLSLGYPATETSLCAQFGWVSKVIVIAMEVRGRHRGLPHALDHAILLPCEKQEDAQGEWWWKRWLKRRTSNISHLFSHEAGEVDRLL
ncbi:cation transport protein-domain-containing protein [Aspergillus ambiguus]|uniref:cation transport protein-domain-containing protein n=1 Tax=Aspergillus ambiguus TaxID=176160 RepID=UPI003CCD5718